jgi:hypothetical protein
MGEGDMITIYEFGTDGLWTGATREIGEDEGVKGNWTRAAPPTHGVDEHVRWTGGQWAIVTSEEMLASLKSDKLAVLAAKRWEVETGGIEIAGLQVKTDEDTQRKITGAYVRATRDPEFTVRWKIGPASFVTLDAQTIVAIGDAVTAHIQAAFNRESELVDAVVQAATWSELVAIEW